ncbi:MAG TPA: SCO family protein [Longimicrobiaceae bacterium]|nr:SCO family protein [Longimicrobiaceae bacterium]
MTSAKPSAWVTAALLAGCALVAGLAGFGAYRLAAGPPAFHGTTYQPPRAAPEFSLTDHDGRPVTLATYRGEPVLLFFGFTHCPDVCPLTLNRLARVAGGARILLVTVDPARDTPAALRAYAARFGERVTGLTGEPAALERARAGYGAFAEPAHGGHGMLAHTPVVYGIDRRGVLRVVISESATEAQVADDVRTLARF